MPGPILIYFWTKKSPETIRRGRLNLKCHVNTSCVVPYSRALYIVDFSELEFCSVSYLSFLACYQAKNTGHLDTSEIIMKYITLNEMKCQEEDL